jgi:hypothetical protein
MTQKKPPLYVEFNAARDGFCLAEDVASANPKVVQGGFSSVQEAASWAGTNGYVLNEYVDGVLQLKS